MKKKLLLMMLAGICLLNACDTKEVVNENKNADLQESITENLPENIMQQENQTVQKEKPYHEAYPEIEPVKLHIAPSEPIENTGLRDLTIHFENPDYAFSKKQSATAYVSIGDTQNAAAQISLFGNSTVECAKRPIKIKFQESQTIGDGGKKFYLISNIYDKSLIHNYVVFDLAKYIDGGFYVPSCEFVNVYATYDGIEKHGYQGVYLLAEKIGQSEYDSNNLEYVFEEDYRVYYDDPENGKEGLDWFWLGENYIQSFAVKGDTSEEICEDIKVKLQTIWNVIGEKNWEEIQRYVDVENITKSFLLDELIKDPDVGQTSVYWGIRNDGRLCIVGIWDNDLTFGSGEVGQANEDLVCLKNALFARLYKVPEFKEFYKQYFIIHCEEWKEHINNTIDEVTTTYYDDLENDFLHWESYYNWCNEEMKTLDYEGQLEYMKFWLEERIQFLKNEL